jgi:hypothetical protein
MVFVALLTEPFFPEILPGEHIPSVAQELRAQPAQFSQRLVRQLLGVVLVLEGEVQLLARELGIL